MDPKLYEIAPLEREQRLYERVVDKIIDLIQGNTWGCLLYTSRCV